MTFRVAETAPPILPSQLPCEVSLAKRKVAGHPASSMPELGTEPRIAQSSTNNYTTLTLWFPTSSIFYWIRNTSSYFLILSSKHLCDLLHFKIQIQRTNKLLQRRQQQQATCTTFHLSYVKDNWKKLALSEELMILNIKLYHFWES